MKALQLLKAAVEVDCCPANTEIRQKVKSKANYSEARHMWRATRKTVVFLEINKSDVFKSNNINKINACLVMVKVL